MANSTITLTFTENLPLGTNLGIGIGNNGNPFGGAPATYDYVFRWVNIRFAIGHVTRGTPTAIDGEIDAINFVSAFNLDVPGYTVTRVDNVVTIEAPTFISGGFTSYTYFYTPVTIGAHLITNHESINIVIDNATEDVFTIDSVVFEEADTTPCTHVKVTVETNVLATRVLSPFVDNANTVNPLVFERLRGEMIILELENENGTTVQEVIEIPPALNISNFTITTTPSPNGSTIVISNNYSGALTLEYSLDNVNWQESNVFSGIVSDDYTLYIRDNLGCSTSQELTVNDTGIYTPSFYLSKSNSIRFAQRITFGDSSNYKNDENTLSCEVNVEIPYHEVQLFQTADIVTTQFKSNYALNVVKVVRADNSEVNVPVVKKTSNIGIKDKRDARKYNLGSGKTGIYFISGNVYDYDTGFATGTHALNKTLPEWGITGNYINIAGSWFLIENTVFDETKNADVLVINEIYTGAEINVIVGSIYNVFEYEVYEFEIDMADYIDESIRVKITASDPNFTTINFLSEEINVQVRHENTLEIRYWNDTNNDVFYETGIKHKIRIPFTRVEGLSDEESTIHKTDTNAILLGAEMYEGKKFIFEPMTEELWRKVMMALSHRFVFIDNVRYTKNGDFDSEGPLDDTNLYVLKANMLKSGGVYGTDGSGFGTVGSGQIEVPGLIEGDTGFIKY